VGLEDGGDILCEADTPGCGFLLCEQKRIGGEDSSDPQKAFRSKVQTWHMSRDELASDRCGGRYRPSGQRVAFVFLSTPGPVLPRCASIRIRLV